MKKLFQALGWVFLFIITALGVTFVTLWLLMYMFCNGPSESAKKTFVATMLETGGMKFVVSWYMTDDEVMAIMNEGIASAAPVSEKSADTDASLVNMNEKGSVSGNSGDGMADSSIPEALRDAYAQDTDGDGLILVPVTSHTFSGGLLVIKDPSRLSLSSSYPWSDETRNKDGLTVGEHCEQSSAVAGINAGEYVTSGTNWGGMPVGVVVENGEILYNGPSYGDVMVGFNSDHVLILTDVGGMSASAFESYVKDNNRM